MARLSHQLVMCGGKICIRKGRGWGEEGGGIGGQLPNRLFMRQVNINEDATLTI